MLSNLREMMVDLVRFYIFIWFDHGIENGEGARRDYFLGAAP